MGDGTAQVIFVGNQKGGVGKTTNCVQLAAAFQDLGHKCLIVDLDANQGASMHLGVDGDDYLGTYEVLIGEEEPFDVIVDDVSIDLIPAGRSLERINRRAKVSRDLLSEPLVALRARYDFIFLDTAPNLTVPTIAAYYGADWFVLSVMPEPFAIAGLKSALAHIRSASQKSHGQLLGILFSGMADAPGFWERLLGNREEPDLSLVDYIDEKLVTSNGRSLRFDTMISRSSVIPLCQKQGKTLFQSAPRHNVAEQYRTLAKEIEARIQLFISEES